MARKLENYPLDVLVLAFCTKWGLRIYDEVTTEELVTPCVLIVNGKTRKYQILFTNSMSSIPHVDMLSKKKIIDPEHNFAYFKLDQLEKNREKTQKATEEVRA